MKRHEIWKKRHVSRVKNYVPRSVCLVTPTFQFCFIFYSVTRYLPPPLHAGHMSQYHLLFELSVWFFFTCSSSAKQFSPRVNSLRHCLMCWTNIIILNCLFFMLINIWGANICTRHKLNQKYKCYHQCERWMLIPWNTVFYLNFRFYASE